MTATRGHDLLQSKLTVFIYLPEEHLNRSFPHLMYFGTIINSRFSDAAFLRLVASVASGGIGSRCIDHLCVTRLVGSHLDIVGAGDVITFSCFTSAY